MIIANMATFPDRANVVESAVAVLSPQVDVLNICLNEFDNVPNWCSKYNNINAVVPERDWKDVGKFIFDCPADADVFLVDDDIVYPRDYVERMLALREVLELEQVVLGAHAIIYSDFFDGMAHSRNVRSFRLEEQTFRLVNQLGTGTILVRGDLLPPLSYMEGSQRFVDVRFARYQYEKCVPLVSIPRESGWMKDREGASEGIFEGFTTAWPDDVIEETLSFAGYAKLDVNLLKKLKEILE